MRSTLLKTIGNAACLAVLSVFLTGCIIGKTTNVKADDKCTDDCCKDDGKAVVVNKAKESVGAATQPAAIPATQPSK